MNGVLCIHAHSGQVLFARAYEPNFGLPSDADGPPVDELQLGALLFAWHLNASEVDGASSADTQEPALRAYKLGDVAVHYASAGLAPLLVVVIVAQAVSDAHAGAIARDIALACHDGTLVGDAGDDSWREEGQPQRVALSRARIASVVHGVLLFVTPYKLVRACADVPPEPPAWAWAVCLGHGGVDQVQTLGAWRSTDGPAWPPPPMGVRGARRSLTPRRSNMLLRLRSHAEMLGGQPSRSAWAGHQPLSQPHEAAPHPPPLASPSWGRRPLLLQRGRTGSIARSALEARVTGPWLVDLAAPGKRNGPAVPRLPRGRTDMAHASRDTQGDGLAHMPRLEHLPSMLAHLGAHSGRADGGDALTDVACTVGAWSDGHPRFLLLRRRLLLIVLATAAEASAARDARPDSGARGEPSMQEIVCRLAPVLVQLETFVTGNLGAPVPPNRAKPPHTQPPRAGPGVRGRRPVPPAMRATAMLLTTPSVPPSGTSVPHPPPGARPPRPGRPARPHPGVVMRHYGQQQAAQS